MLHLGLSRCYTTQWLMTRMCCTRPVPWPITKLHESFTPARHARTRVPSHARTLVPSHPYGISECPSLMSYSLSPQDFPDFVENLGSDIFEGENRFGGGAKFQKIEKNNKRIFLLHTRIEPKDKICDKTQNCILQNESKSEWGEKIIGIHENTKWIEWHAAVSWDYAYSPDTASGIQPRRCRAPGLH